MLSGLKEMMEYDGIDIFGTSDVSKVVPDRFKKTPYALSLGIRLSSVVMEEVKNGPTRNYFHHYRTVNTRLDLSALKSVVYLQRLGYDAMAIPASQTTNNRAIAGDFSHKTAANLAGIGFIGKSGLLVTREFGPRVRLVTVLTNLELTGNTMKPPACGSCDLCVKACPCGAITGRQWEPGCTRDDLVDASLCSAYMKQQYAMIGRGAVCGICAAVCPFGKKKAP